MRPLYEATVQNIVLNIKYTAVSTERMSNGLFFFLYMKL